MSADLPDDAAGGHVLTVDDLAWRRRKARRPVPGRRRGAQAGLVRTGAWQGGIVVRLGVAGFRPPAGGRAAHPVMGVPPAHRAGDKPAGVLRLVRPAE